MNPKIPTFKRDFWRILVVDDDPAILQLLKKLLSPEYGARGVSSGVEAIRLIKKYKFEIIISNQKMPGITGIELLKIVSEIQPTAVGILVTGYTDVEMVEEEMKRGIIYRYIVKPWNDENLKMLVSQAAQYYEQKNKQLPE